MHRAIVERRGVVIPPGYVVDHGNHNSLDNRFRIAGKPQLEVITQTENMKRSPGWKKKGEKYEQSISTVSARETFESAEAVPCLG